MCFIALIVNVLHMYLLHGALGIICVISQCTRIVSETAAFVSNLHCSPFKARQECGVEKKRADQLEAEVAEAERELLQLEAVANEMDELEERYWHDFNDYHLQLQVI